MKPRLIILTNRLIVGGISNDIIPLAYYLRDEFDILILYGEKGKDEADADFLLKKYPGLQLKKIKQFKKQINPFNDLNTYSRLKKEIRNFKPDIVHTHGAKSGFIGRLAAHKSSVPCIIHTFHGHFFHSYFNNVFTQFLKLLERKLTTITTTIIATSKQQQEDLAINYKIANVRQVKIIQLGIDGQQFSPAAKNVHAFREKYNLNDAVSIGLVARIAKIKNYDLFIEVVSMIKNDGLPPVKFFVIGDGYLKKEIQYKLSLKNISWCNADDYSDKCTVVFTSWVPDVADVVSALDIVILTSNNEGTGLSLAEAQFLGTPVVSTNVGGVRDTVIDGETGFLVEPGNANEMYKKLKLLIEKPVLRKEMGIKAEAFAKKRFSKQAEVERYKQLYKSLIVLTKTESPEHLPVTIG